MTVSPVISELILQPGKETTYRVIVINNADIPLGIHASVTGFNSFPENSPMIQWTNVNPKDAIMDAHQQTAFTVAIDTPGNITKGGYYATVFFTPFITRPQDAPGPIILTRVGTLVIATYGTINYRNLSQKVMVKNFFISSVTSSLPATNIRFSIKNNYFAYFTAKPFLTLKPLFGKQTSYLLDEKHILPAESKDWNTMIFIHPATMIYKAQLAVSVGQGHYVYATTYFLVVPHFFEMLSACLLILCIISTFLARKRLLRSFRIIISGK